MSILPPNANDVDVKARIRNSDVDWSERFPSLCSRVSDWSKTRGSASKAPDGTSFCASVLPLACFLLATLCHMR